MRPKKICKCGAQFDPRWGKTGKVGRGWGTCPQCRRSKEQAVKGGRKTRKCKQCQNMFAPRWGKKGLQGRGFVLCPVCRKLEPKKVPARFVAGWKKIRKHGNDVYR